MSIKWVMDWELSDSKEDALNLCEKGEDSKAISVVLLDDVKEFYEMRERCKSGKLKDIEKYDGYVTNWFTKYGFGRVVEKNEGRK